MDIPIQTSINFHFQASIFYFSQGLLGDCIASLWAIWRTQPEVDPIPEAYTWAYTWICLFLQTQYWYHFSDHTTYLIVLGIRMADAPSQVQHNYHQGYESAVKSHIQLKLYALYNYLSVTIRRLLWGTSIFFLCKSQKWKACIKMSLFLQNQWGGHITLHDNLDTNWWWLDWWPPGHRVCFPLGKRSQPEPLGLAWTGYWKRQHPSMWLPEAQLLVPSDGNGQWEQQLHDPAVQDGDLKKPHGWVPSGQAQSGLQHQGVLKVDANTAVGYSMSH